MKKAIKLKGKLAQAYELGTASEAERSLMEMGRIRALTDGTYEIFSLEAINGHGEIAQSGDFFKIDSFGYPYPIKRDFFIANHQHIKGNLYEQTPRPLEAWTPDDGMCKEIEYLIAHKGLVIDETSHERYLTAPLYGTLESAARDAVIVFYELSCDDNGQIIDATFNFVDRKEFNLNYEWID